MKPLKVAIVHDYLNQMGGAERVVAVFHKMFPDAPIYTTIADRGILLKELQDADIRTTWMQRIPGVLQRFKQFFWLYPFAVQSMDLREYDLVLSSSSAYAKGVPISGKTVHICYCHTPMRFAWDFATYMEGMKVPAPVKWLASHTVKLLKQWDIRSTRRVHHLIANSSVVQQRIESCYDRQAVKIYPPVDIERYEMNPEPAGDYFLVVSRLVSYKKIDLAVQACSRLGKKLVVIGGGPDLERLRSLAGDSVQFTGRLPDEEVVRYMRNCRAFLFPGLEDFGITPLEANACGRPVIAYRGGGALDTVIPGVNGCYFAEQTVDSLAAALEEFELMSWNPLRIRQHAEKFSEQRFKEELLALVERHMQRDSDAYPYVAVTKT
ncbi:glycosyltransferase [Paenibacillus puerhi]|uniref:glycosyltransferase n=1 Tax=Paenibacillus puerhi TaxID=2692622 RepID=UPI001F274600|nr:glycosyltransferase [Paenibacillus puerhi]